jgi:hypothetical protein
MLSAAVVIALVSASGSGGAGVGSGAGGVAAAEDSGARAGTGPGARAGTGARAGGGTGAATAVSSLDVDSIAAATGWRWVVETGARVLSSYVCVLAVGSTSMEEGALRAVCHSRHGKSGRVARAGRLWRSISFAPETFCGSFLSLLFLRFAGGRKGLGEVGVRVGWLLAGRSRSAAVPYWKCELR